MRSLLLLLAVAAPPALAQGAEHLVGRPYAGLPGGWAETAGGLLGPLDGDVPVDGPSYTLSEHRRLADEAHLFVYDRIDQMHRGRHPISTVLAALVVEDVRDGETATAFGCGLRGGGYRDDARVVAVVGQPALVEREHVYRFGAVRLAWHLDRRAARFVAVAPDRVECFDQEPVD